MKLLTCTKKCDVEIKQDFDLMDEDYSLVHTYYPSDEEEIEEIRFLEPSDKPAKQFAEIVFMDGSTAVIPMNCFYVV